jgi:hypothetical protein
MNTPVIALPLYQLHQPSFLNGAHASGIAVNSPHALILLSQPEIRCAIWRDKTSFNLQITK